MREGIDFDDCEPHESCELIGRSFAYSVGDPEYPTEWCYDKDGRPQCLAFVPEGAPVPTQRELEAAGQLRLFA